MIGASDFSYVQYFVSCSKISRINADKFSIITYPSSKFLVLLPKQVFFFFFWGRNLFITTISIEIHDVNHDLNYKSVIYSRELIGASDFLYVLYMLYLSNFKTILPGQYLAKTFFTSRRNFGTKFLAVGLVYFPQYQQKFTDLCCFLHS